MSTRQAFPFPVRGRRSVRLRGHDYRSGTYFVTICANDQLHTFGEVIQRRVHLTLAGRIARTCWLDIPRYHPHVHLDAFIVMPNHVHGILRFVDPPVTSDRPRRFGDAQPGSLSTILGTYKAEVAKRINAPPHAWPEALAAQLLRTHRAERGRPAPDQVVHHHESHPVGPPQSSTHPCGKRVGGRPWKRVGARHCRAPTTTSPGLITYASFTGSTST